MVHSEDLELVAAIEQARSAFRMGVTPELARQVYGLVGMYVGYQPVVAWERVRDGDFDGDSVHFAVVGSVPYELPRPLWDYLVKGVGPGPQQWDFRPFVPARVTLVVAEADPTGINRLLERPYRRCQ